MSKYRFRTENLSRMIAPFVGIPCFIEYAIAKNIFIWLPSFILFVYCMFVVIAGNDVIPKFENFSSGIKKFGAVILNFFVEKIEA